MKTIEEVKAFLASFRFCRTDSDKIMGFLLGKGVIEKGTFVNFTATSHVFATFNEFYEWFEDDDTRLEDLMNFLQDEQDAALEKGDIEKADKMALYLGYLVEALCLEYDEVEDDEK